MEAYAYMGFEPGQRIRGTRVDVAFIGSCTNGRLSDLRGGRAVKAGQVSVAPHVRALVVPGSQSVRRAMIDKGYDKVFSDAGFEFREAGCSMCLAMNPDQLVGRELCASSSNRNFKGRQGSPDGSHAADDPGDGRGRRRRRRSRRCPRTGSRRTRNQ